MGRSLSPLAKFPEINPIIERHPGPLYMVGNQKHRLLILFYHVWTRFSQNATYLFKDSWENVKLAVPRIIKEDKVYSYTAKMGLVHCSSCCRHVWK